MYCTHLLSGSAISAENVKMEDCVAGVKDDKSATARLDYSTIIVVSVQAAFNAVLRKNLFVY